MRDENPFVLDSGRPTGNFEEFLMSEVRFSSLKKKNEKLAQELFEQAKEEAMERYKRYEALSRH